MEQFSLPDIVVKAESVNSFKGRLDKFWSDQEVKFNWEADIKGMEVIYYKFYFKALIFLHAVSSYTGH